MLASVAPKVACSRKREASLGVTIGTAGGNWRIAVGDAVDLHGDGGVGGSVDIKCKAQRIPDAHIGAIAGVKVESSWARSDNDWDSGRVGRGGIGVADEQRKGAWIGR